MTRDEVVERLCKLQAEAHAAIGYGSAADCFCGEGGFWGVDGYGGNEGYRNEGVVLEFMENAVRSALATRPSDPVPPEPREPSGYGFDWPHEVGAIMAKVDNYADEQMRQASRTMSTPDYTDCHRLRAEVAAALFGAWSRRVPPDNSGAADDTRRLDFIEHTGAALLPVEGNIMPAGTYAVEQAGDDVDMGPGPRGAIDEAMRVAARRATTEGAGTEGGSDG